MTTHEITNSEDIIDSRDIIERIEELQSTIKDLELDTDKDDFQEELNNLLKIQDECENYSEWKYGESLIRDSYFEEYAEELVKVIGDLPSNLPNYIEHNIDWAGVADDIQQDYTSVDFDGVDYWIRCS